MPVLNCVLFLEGLHADYEKKVFKNSISNNSGKVLVKETSVVIALHYIYIIYSYISRRILTVKVAGLNPHSGSHWKRLSRRQRRRLVSLNYRVTDL